MDMRKLNTVASSPPTRKITMSKLLITALLLLSACTGKPDNIKPVENFQAEKYLGTWYEIARIDHRFEKGLSRVTAEYSKREGGGITVVNRGLEAKSGTWKQSTGKAFFVDGEDKGHLKVSFFGPFYGAYVVFELDVKDYQYALVSGPDTSYFWLLSRTPTMDSALRERLIDMAVAKGFRRGDILLVDQSPLP
jgi:apolipoprotein D and lipocalin family protein